MLGVLGIVGGLTRFMWLIFVFENRPDRGAMVIVRTGDADAAHQAVRSLVELER